MHFYTVDETTRFIFLILFIFLNYYNFGINTSSTSINNRFS